MSIFKQPLSLLAIFLLLQIPLNSARISKYESQGSSSADNSRLSSTGSSSSRNSGSSGNNHHYQNQQKQKPSRTSANGNNATTMQHQHQLSSTSTPNTSTLCNVTEIDPVSGLPRPAPGGCPLAGMDMRRLTLEIIRHEILRKLHMDEDNLPNITLKNYPIEPSILNQFMNVQNDTPLDDEDEDGVSTEKIIAFSRMHPIKSSDGKTTRSAHYFSFSDKLMSTKIHSALLHLHMKYVPSNGGSGSAWPDYRIRIYEILPGKKGDSAMIYTNGSSLKPDVASPAAGSSGGGGGTQSRPTQHQSTRHRGSMSVQTKWIQVNIGQILQTWVAKIKHTAERKIGFFIEAVDLSDRLSSEISVMMTTTTEVDVNINPFIEIRPMLEINKQRLPRNIGMECDENSRETRCCRFPLTIDFEEFGWDWIIAPKTYEANYCSGECPFAFLQKYPHNHIIQQAIPTGIGGPCCAARKMSPITMLYFDKESNIVFSVLNGMVVDKCGCS